MKLLLKYLGGYKNVLVGALCLAAINQIFSLLDPQIFRIIIDRYATNFSNYSQADFISGVGLLLLGAVGVAFVSRVAKNFQDYYVNAVTQKVGAKLYETSVAHSLSLPYAVFEDQRSGELLQKLQKARLDSQTLIANAVNVIFFSLVGIVFVLIYAFFVHWTIGAAYSLLIPVIGITTYLISRKIKSAQKEIVTQTAELAGSTTETIRNVELVKSLGLEDQETSRLNYVNKKILELELKKIKLIRKLSFIQGTTINAVRSAIMLLMFFLIFQKIISLGEFFSILFYSFFIFNPLGEFGNVASQYQEAKASMENLEKVFEIKSEEKPKNPRPLSEISKIEFKNVGFSYGSIKTPSVKDASFTINRGETAAFVGPSGSGKTTMVKLLVGLYRPSSGKILFNNTNSLDINPVDLRGKIGYVSQETQLFAGTIRENLLFVNPEASDKECLKALDHASATPIIERGGQGLDTKIGEGGIKISGGERQRLAIARALLRQPELIIFDEATSSLDSITEKSITETIKKISKVRPNLITLLVAHRLSTISHADKIFVLENGEIIEEGSHEKLLRQKGLYAALWREQGGAFN